MKKIAKLSMLVVMCLLCVLALIACADTQGTGTTNTSTDTNTNSNTNSNTNTNTDTNTDTGSQACEHRMGNWFTSKALNCQGIGEETRICDFCDYQEVREIEGEAGECNYTDWATVLEAGCTETGIEARICKDCNDVETKSIEMLVHTEEDWAITTAPTCTDTGVETCNCRCAEERVADALGHNIETAPSSAPTQEYTGITTYWTCTRCKIEGGDETVPPLSEVTNVASLGTYSHNATDFWAFNPAMLYDGKEDNGTRSPKGGDYSIFVDYSSEYYVTTFKLKCNGAGTLTSGSTELAYTIKNISINFYDRNGEQIYTTGKTDVSSSEYIECEVNEFITRVEIQIFGGGHGGGEFLWELYIMAPPTIIRK